MYCLLATIADDTKSVDNDVVVSSVVSVVDIAFVKAVAVVGVFDDGNEVWMDVMVVVGFCDAAIDEGIDVTVPVVIVSKAIFDVASEDVDTVEIVGDAINAVSKLDIFFVLCEVIVSIDVVANLDVDDVSVVYVVADDEVVDKLGVDDVVAVLVNEFEAIVEVVGDPVGVVDVKPVGDIWIKT